MGRGRTGTVGRYATEQRDTDGDAFRRYDRHSRGWAEVSGSPLYLCLLSFSTVLRSLLLCRLVRCWKAIGELRQYSFRYTRLLSFCSFRLLFMKAMRWRYTYKATMNSRGNLEWRRKRWEIYFRIYRYKVVCRCRFLYVLKETSKV